MLGDGSSLEGLAEGTVMLDTVLPNGRTLKCVPKLSSRLTIVSREAKKKQRPLSEYFTRITSKKFANAQTTPPLQLAPSYYRPSTFLLYRISKPRMVEIGASFRG